MSLLSVQNLRKTYGRFVALNQISFELGSGKTLGILGESGSGKTTLARIVLGLLKPDSGKVCFAGKRMGAVFQDPLLSLDPRMRVSAILEEPFCLAKQKASETDLKNLLSQVELPTGFLKRYPRELSGGECQRIAIARAIALEPSLIVCDEPVSAVDAFTRAQILNLLMRLQTEKQISYLFISHDIRVVRHMSDDVMILKDGEICEKGAREQIFANPQYPYSRALLEA
jgi:peptide/nickel transport system ATP-binding protein